MYLLRFLGLTVMRFGYSLQSIHPSKVLALSRYRSCLMHELVLRDQRVVGLYFAVSLPYPIITVPVAGTWGRLALFGRSVVEILCVNPQSVGLGRRDLGPRV